MDQLSLTKEKLAIFANYREGSPGALYELPEDLNDAVEIAIALNQPLLVTGEPGTGKTLLARKVAADLYQITNGAYNEVPYTFFTKSSSSYNDLFYTYDAITHFYNANIEKPKEAPQLKKYIELNALGLAIAASMEPAEKNSLPANNIPGDEVPPNSVVLIDEIDKAPNDFPNDLLFEIEQYKFRIRESGMREFSKGKNAHILIILTSNGEKKLPDAFLRRCVFFNIGFPDKDFLVKILKKHALLDGLKGKQDLVLEKFKEIRETCTDKKPSTAELLAWIKILIEKNTKIDDPNDLAGTLPVIVKSDNDRKAIRQKWNL